MRAFVTGGTGFIGSHVVQRLRDRGDEVVVLARRPEKAAGLDAEVVQGDLSDGDAIRRGMEGCQAVFHIAADYRVGMDPSKQDSMRDSNIARHRARARRGGRRRRGEDRLRLHDQRLRQHERPDRRRELPPQRGRRLRLDLRRDQVPRSPDRRAARGRGRADRDRAAGLGLRPGRPRARGPDDRPGEHGQDAGEGVPRARAEHGARGRRGRRDHARLRQGQARRVVRARRRDHDPGRPDRQGRGDRRQEAAADDRAAGDPEGDDPGEPLDRAPDGPAAELPGDDLGRPQRDLLGEGRQGPPGARLQPRDLDTGLRETIRTG